MSLVLKIAGTSYTLEAANVRSLVHTVQACQPATLSAEIYASGIPTTGIAAFTAVELWVDGVRRFAGTLQRAPRLGYDAGRSYIALNATDLLGRLRSITYERPVMSWTGKTTPAPSEWGWPTGMDVSLYTLSGNWTSTVGLFSSGIMEMGTDDEGNVLYAARAQSSSTAELSRLAVYLSQRHGVEFDLGTIAGLPSKNTGDVVTSIDCLSVLQKCAALRPDATFWIDPSAGTNRLNYITRDHCTEVTLDVAETDKISANACGARDDLQVGYLKWRLTWTAVRADGSTYDDSTTVELGDPTCPPERRLVRTFALGKFADSTAITGLPYSWEVPTGAAAAYWAAASVLHYEGSVSITEPSGVTYAYGLGQVLNFANWQPGYETARALVRGVTYDLVACTTSLEFGPPDSLTPQDYLSIAASSLGSYNPASDPTDPTADPATDTGSSGDLPAHVTEGIYNLFSVLGTTGEVQTIEGPVTIRGHAPLHSSFEEPVPRRWLDLNFSGSYAVTQSGFGLICRAAVSGTAHHSPTTDSVSTTTVSFTSSGTPSAWSSHVSSLFQGPGNISAQYPWFISSAVEGYARGVPTYIGQNDGGPYLAAADIYPSTWGDFLSDGRVIATLTNECTDEVAMSAQLGDTWGTPNDISRRSWYESRTGLTFSVRRARLHGYTWECSVYGMPVVVSIPIYRYAYGTTRPSTPTRTEKVYLTLEQVGTTTTTSSGLTVTTYKGKATLPDWELPFEKGYTHEVGDLTITLQ